MILFNLTYEISLRTINFYKLEAITKQKFKILIQNHKPKLHYNMFHLIKNDFTNAINK